MIRVYEFKCNECKEEYEFNDRITDFVCCGDEPVRRVYTIGGVTFKGSGFHKNDYKKE